MPIFEFVCTTCQDEFEELVFSHNAVDSVTCPQCDSPQIQKKISTFASKISGGSSFAFDAAPAASCSTGST